MENLERKRNILEADLFDGVADEEGVFFRGKKYYLEGNVDKESIRVSKNKANDGISITGNVEGADLYYSGLSFSLSKGIFRDSNCDCPYGARCKHSVALGLEFIDIYIKFLKQNNYTTLSNVELRNELIDFINKSDGASAKVIEAEYEEVDNKALTNRLQELAGIFGVDIDKLPENVIKQAIEILEKRPSSYLSKDVVSQPKSSFIASEEMDMLPRPINEKYYIVIKFASQIEIFIKLSAYVNRRPEYILRNEKESLTKAQVSLFRFLENNNYIWSTHRIDFENFFFLFKNSGMKLYIEKKDPRNEILLEENSEKIKAELYQKGDQFIFKIDEKFKPSEYGKRSKCILYRGRNNCLVVDGNTVSLHVMSKDLMEIIANIDFSTYSYDDNLEAELDISNLLQLNYLNNVIRDGKKYLDFKTHLEPKFKISKFDSNRLDKTLLIDYDSQADTLNIKAVVDYGFTKQNVAETNQYSRRSRGSAFRRRDNAPIVNLVKIDGYSINYAEIKEKQELSFFKAIYNNNFGFNKRGECNKKGAKEIFDYYKIIWPTIEKSRGIKVEFVRDQFNFVTEDFKANFDVDFNAKDDWLAFDVKCYCGSDKISLVDLRRYIENREEFIKMADGRMLKVTNLEELERFILMLESFHAKENDKFEGKIYHAPELEDIFTSSEHYNAKVSEGFSAFMKEANSGKPVKKVRLSAKFATVLRDYQKEGVDWFYFLRKYRFAGVLADDMGIGKTLQTLTLLEMNKVKDKPSIVICPKTLLFNWQDEVDKFTPKIRTIILDGSQSERREKINNIKNYDLAITSYATMQKDAEIYEAEKINFNYCVLDEAQNIKNHATKSARIVKRINADYRLALTGTPLENSVSEIWSVFDFLMPGFLGSNKAFVKKFQTPIMKQNNIQALKNLRKKISVFMLRRTKDKVLKELPSKIEQVSHCQLELSQNILYQEVLASVKSEIFNTVAEKGFAKSQIHILAGLTKLRQICNHPVLLLKDQDYSKYESAKLNIFLELLHEIIGAKRKVLVFSQFTKMLDILASELDKENIKHSYLSGKTKNRQVLVREFNESEDKQVFLISLKAGGTGLNLTSADNVIIFDPWWNPSVEMQAVDRAHRIGQTKSVNVYRLITKGTIEDKIVSLQEKKKFLFDNMVGESHDMFKKLTWDDVKELFR
ncbi:DEAD/DEAH box helicase [Patescibacteria group bacterium]|nr:DEAD/DEAH box helicase [Patescibacteria group bacterium]